MLPDDVRRHHRQIKLYEDNLVIITPIVVLRNMNIATFLGQMFFIITLLWTVWQMFRHFGDFHLIPGTLTHDNSH